MKTFIFLIRCSGTLLLSVFTTACGPACEDKWPEEKTAWGTKYKSLVDALQLPINDEYHDAERCSDEWKIWIRSIIPPLSNRELIDMGNDIHFNNIQGPFVYHEKARWAQEIVARMKPYLVENKFHYNVYVIQSPEFNAFTIPGGNIYLTTGLLDAVQNPDELAFIIGHELGHNENDHTREKARLIRFCMNSGIFGDLVEICSVGCSKADELECDFASVYLLSKAGYDPEKAINALEILKRFSPPKAGALTLENIWWTVFGSHPWTEDRIGYVRAYVSQSKIKVACDEIVCKKGVTEQSPMYMREYPSIYSTVFITLPKGAEVEVICDCVEQENQQGGNDWLYVEYRDGKKTYRGWIDKTFVNYDSKRQGAQ